MVIEFSHAHDDSDLIVPLHPQPGKVAVELVDHGPSRIIFDYSVRSLGLAHPNQDDHQKGFGDAFQGLGDFFRMKFSLLFKLKVEDTH